MIGSDYLADVQSLTHQTAGRVEVDERIVRHLILHDKVFQPLGYSVGNVSFSVDMPRVTHQTDRALWRYRRKLPKLHLRRLSIGSRSKQQSKHSKYSSHNDHRWILNYRKRMGRPESWPTWLADHS